MHYPYTDNDNLVNPLTYQYSKFAGKDFIHAWRRQRQRLLGQLPSASLPSLTLVDKTTARLVPAIEVLRKDEKITDDELLWPLRLLKKFEVSKRLYSSYNDFLPFRPQSDDYTGLNNYFLLAEICIRQWQQQRKTYWLSGLLKLTDTLCTQFSRMTLAQQSQLTWILELEQTVIAEMLEESKICC